LYHTSNDFVLLAGWHQAFWISFGLTVAFSACILVLVTWMMRRLTKTSYEAAPPTFGPDWVVFLCVAGLLVTGGIVKHTTSRDVTFLNERYEISLRYPPSRLKPTTLLSTAATASPQLAPIFSGQGSDGGAFTISVTARKESSDLAAIDPRTYISTAEPLSLSLESINVAGHSALRAKYSYLTKTDSLSGSLPEVVWAYTDIVPAKNYTYAFTFQAGPWSFRQQQHLYQAILDSVQLTARRQGIP